MRADEIANSKCREDECVNDGPLRVTSEVCGRQSPAEEVRHAEDELKPGTSKECPLVVSSSRDVEYTEQTSHVGDVGSDGDPDDRVGHFGGGVAEYRLYNGHECSGGHLE